MSPKCVAVAVLLLIPGLILADTYPLAALIIPIVAIIVVPKVVRGYRSWLDSGEEDVSKDSSAK